MTMYVDVETTGLDPRLDGEIRIVSINGSAYDVWDKGQREQALKELDSHEGELFVAHNAQFDLDWLAEDLQWYHTGPVWDTMVGWQVLQCGRDMRANLATVAKHMAGVELDKAFQKGPWDGLVDNQMLQYAADDTYVLSEIHRKQVQALREAGLSKVMELEMLLLPSLLASKRRGVKIDRGAAQKLIRSLEGQIEVIQASLPVGVNPRAPSQVAEYFNLPDSTEDTLREAYKRKPSPELKRVMEARKLLKKISSVRKQILKHVRYDRRIHPSFHQTFTETGRLSSREPNLQNQDRGEDIRGLFIPEQGYRFVIADYSQLELRIAALLSGDEAMLKAYRDGRDLHSETCQRIFGEETKKTRTLSKNINFGFIFGGGHATLMRFAAKSGVDIKEEDAKAYKRAFMDAYPTLIRWQQRQGNTKPEFVHSVLGRRRYITPGEAYCTRINHPVQSSAADGMKIAMIRLHKYRGILPILNVHDELIVEVPENQADDARDIVESEMVKAMYRATKQSEHDPVIEIKVEAGVAESWAEK